jgi:hypothetical protein
MLQIKLVIVPGSSPLTIRFFPFSKACLEVGLKELILLDRQIIFLVSL